MKIGNWPLSRFLQHSYTAPVTCLPTLPFEYSITTHVTLSPERVCKLGYLGLAIAIYIVTKLACKYLARPSPVPHEGLAQAERLVNAPRDYTLVYSLFICNTK